ncbi:MAG: ABC transporter substrate-binding protein [Lachnospiraceae bacterium]|nr:ABC transporter substrate-binding protein [Lachnospiraceae bacterium]
MKKFFAVLLAVIMVISMMAACGGNDSGKDSTAAPSGEQKTEGEKDTKEEGSEQGGGSSAQDLIDALPATLKDGEVVAVPEMYPDIDLSQPYTVYLYSIGGEPNDMADVLAKINERLAPFNTTLDMKTIAWGDASTKYSLVLAGGEQIDAIFTAPWEYMWVEGQKGSFYTLTDEFLQKYMPLTWKYQNHKFFEETKLAGQMIAISCNNEKPENKIVAIRQDLAEKYGITELKNWDDYMNFMLTIAEKETPESGILAEAASGGNAELLDVYRQQYDTFTISAAGLSFDYSYNGTGAPEWEDIQFRYETDWYRDFCKDMKTLADAGCWSRGALNGDVSDDDAFAALTGASIAWNGTVFNYMKQAEKTEGVKCAAYDLTTDHLVKCEEANNGDLAIAKASKNPERTAMVLDLIKMDTEINRLFHLGIEGVHYNMESDGRHYTRIAEKTEDYGPNSMSISWGTHNGLYEEAGAPERETVMYDSWRERMVGCPTVTFVFDKEKVGDYVDAVSSILGDYTGLQSLGLVDDVDASIDELIGRLNDAGLPQIKEELERQFKEWKAAQ